MPNSRIIIGLTEETAEKYASFPCFCIKNSVLECLQVLLDPSLDGFLLAFCILNMT